MNIVAALLIFTVIVVVHEFGHFLLAKKNGVEVTEFSVGMGPRIITFCKTDKGMTCKLFCSQNLFEEREDWLISRSIHGSCFRSEAPVLW